MSFLLPNVLQSVMCKSYILCKRFSNNAIGSIACLKNIVLNGKGLDLRNFINPSLGVIADQCKVNINKGITLQKDVPLYNSIPKIVLT